MKSFKNFSDDVILCEAEVKERTRVNIGPKILTPPSETKGIKVGKKQKTFDKKTKKSSSGYEYGKEGRVIAKDVDVFQTRQRTGGYGEKSATRGGQPGVGQTKTVATITQGPYKGATPISSSSRKILQAYAKAPGVGVNPLRSEPGSIPTEGQKRLKKQIAKKIEKKYNIATPEKPKSVVEPSPRTPAAKDAFKDFEKYQKDQTFQQRVLKAIDKLPPEVKLPKPSKPTVAKVQPKQIKTPPTPKLPDLKQRIVPKSTRSPEQVAAQKVSLEKEIKKQQKASEKSAKQTAKAAKAKAWRNLGRSAGAIGAGLEATSEFNKEKAAGSGTKRAVAAGAARAIGGLVGGSVGGAVGGSLLGLPGAVAGGTAGYTAGAELGTKAFKTAAGASAKERAELAKMNRARQEGQTSNIVKGNKAVIKDPTTGKDTVGFAAYRGGQKVYKAGAGPESLRSTSSNPLERIGRTVLPGAYKDSDDKKLRQQIAKLKK